MDFLQLIQSKMWMTFYEKAFDLKGTEKSLNYILYNLSNMQNSFTSYKM